MADPKRSLDIEAALRWAFRDELPKVSALDREELDERRSSGTMSTGRTEFVSDVQLMMGMSTNCFGVLQAVGAKGPAHPDAIVIGDAA
jgi:hypothetical protein